MLSPTVLYVLVVQIGTDLGRVRFRPVPAGGCWAAADCCGLLPTCGLLFVRQSSYEYEGSASTFIYVLNLALEGYRSTTNARRSQFVVWAAAYPTQHSTSIRRKHTWLTKHPSSSVASSRGDPWARARGQRESS